MTESRVTLRGWVGVLGHALQQAVCVKPSWTTAPEQLAGAAAVLWQMYRVGSKLWLLVHPNAWLLGEHAGVHCFSHSRRWLRNLAQVLTRAVGARIWPLLSPLYLALRYPIQFLMIDSYLDRSGKLLSFNCYSQTYLLHLLSCFCLVWISNLLLICINFKPMILLITIVRKCTCS